MKLSHFFLRTQKEIPSQEDSKNAELLLRGGFIHKTMAGVYSFLPLGMRVLKKIEQIVRQEMDRAGAVELLMSELSPKDNWTQTGRWDGFDVLYRFEAAMGRECALCPSHEEIVVPIVKHFLRSHKDYPICLYQIQTKFRNEPRAKSGILRGREFLMKDAYSFHTSYEDFEDYYEKMKEVYADVFRALGLGEQTYLVAASGGAFSKYSHEFQTKCETGEDLIFHVPNTAQYYNKEIAPAKAPEVSYKDSEMLEREDVEGKGIIGVEELAKFLDIPVEKTTKTILFETEKGDVIAAAVRGGYDINELKLLDIVGCDSLELASEETVKKVTGADVGYAGLLDLPAEVKVYMDDSMENRMNFEMGANKTDFHSININFGRDLAAPEQFYDFKIAKEGDLEPESGKAYKTFRAIEVGNIFPLKTKFSDAFDLTCLDENGKPAEIPMGCYGIGISRLMGTLAEIFHDENGLIWPEQVAPFQIYIAPIGKDDAAYETAEKLHDELEAAGVEVLLDDRRGKKVGPGQKFADHELIGLPYRMVISERTLEDGEVELVDRKTGESKRVKVEEVVKELTK